MVKLLATCLALLTVAVPVAAEPENKTVDVEWIDPAPEEQWVALIAQTVNSVERPVCEAEICAEAQGVIDCILGAVLDGGGLAEMQACTNGYLRFGFRPDGWGVIFDPGYHTIVLQGVGVAFDSDNILDIRGRQAGVGHFYACFSDTGSCGGY